MNHHCQSGLAPTGEPAKIALKSLIQKKKAHGVLAYLDGKCVAWCAADPLLEQPGHDYCVEKGDETNAHRWSIHCLYVHPQARGRGISKELIKAAIEHSKKNGAVELLAFPIPKENQGRFPLHDAEFSGRFSTYEKLGFKVTERLNDFYEVLSLKF